MWENGKHVVEEFWRASLAPRAKHDEHLRVDREQHMRQK